MDSKNLKLNNKITNNLEIQLNQASLVKVGKITGPHGLDGRVQFIIFSKDYSWVKKIDQIQLQSPTEDYRPKNSSRSHHFSKDFFVEGISSRNNSAIMRLSEIRNRTQAEELAGLEIFVREDLFVSQDSEKPFLREILNFKIHDLQNVEIGTVVGFSTNSAQDILVVQGQDANIFEIPFVDAFVKKLDRETKQIVMDLPEGLIEINKN